MWSSVKENVDGSPPIAFDRDGLELAFKYFCSTTLTMRLAGITQINSHISLFNEMCNAESVVEVENVGLQLAGKENQKRKSIEMTQKIKRIYYHAINYRIWSCSIIPRTKRLLLKAFVFKRVTFDCSLFDSCLNFAQVR